MAQTPTQAQEWRAHWPLALAAMAGCSFASLAAASIGLFMEPLGREFGWGRADVTAGLTIYALIAVPLSPAVGALVDRFGARRIALPGVGLTATAFAAFGLSSGSRAQWLALWTIYSLVGVSVKGSVWTTAVAQRFEAARGLALALTLTGTALMMSFGPSATQFLIARFGWRQAYGWLGIGWGTAVLALLIPFFFDRCGQGRMEKARDALSEADLQLIGLTMAEALHSRPFRRIALANLLTILIVSAMSIHMVPVLTWAGVSRETAAAGAGVAGMASIAGKLATGWMLDRSGGRWIAAISLALPAVAFSLLLGASGLLPVVFLAMAIIGYANGAFLQVSNYMTSRYVGLGHLGKIYGVLASLTALGLGLGPLFASLVYDWSGSYSPFLLGGIPIALVSGALMLGLGPYPDQFRSTPVRALDKLTKLPKH